MNNENYIGILEENESQVRSYCRSFPVVFEKAKGAHLYDVEGNEYLDFLAGAGTMNYGHNNEVIKKAIIDFIEKDYLMHGLDMFTAAKADFVDTFINELLEPRGLKYKLQFCGATGTNAVEAALKLARKNKKRSNIFAFMGAFHGMTLGSLALTTDQTSRAGAGMPLTNTTFLPYPDGCNVKFDTLDYLEAILEDDHSGIDKPAAIVIETVQAEGGIFVAPIPWLQRLEKICKANDILLICDDIQVGCSRTGTFFSFERAGIKPDMVVLSKSISGYGLPMSLLLIKEELDIWKPAEHNGTFRGNQLGFVGAREAILFNKATNLNEEVTRKGKLAIEFIEKEILSLDERLKLRGLGLIIGIDFSKIDIENITKKIAQGCFYKGLIIERAGRKDAVLKLLPPLVITDEELLKGLNIIKEVIKAELSV